jgi:hypothetical protein
MMKAETKAKRRVTLSICSLGMLDESEVASIRAQELAEAARIESVVDRIETDQRPDFESEIGIEAEAPAAEAGPGDYELRAGKLKGKLLKDMAVSKLNTWLDWYNQKTGEGQKYHDDVNSDAGAIQTYLEGLSNSEPNNAAS